MKRNYLLLLLLVLFVALRIPSLYEPFGRDQGIYATVAVNLLEGGTPYKDVWDHKPPGIYFAYALAFAIFGRSMVSIPLFEIFYFLATLLIFYRVARTLCDEGVAALGLAVYVFLSSGIFHESWWGRGQAEVFMVLPIMGMVLCLHKGGRGGSLVGYYFAAGALAGCALLLKQTCLPLIILAVMYTGLPRKESCLSAKSRIGISLRRVSSFVIGLALPLSVVAFCFWIWGGLGELFEAVVVFNIEKHVNRPFDLAFLVRLVKWTGIIGTGFKALWVGILLLSVGGLVLKVVSLRKEDTLFLMWTVGSFLGVCIGWWLFPYHFILLVPPLSLLAAYGILGMFRWMLDGRAAYDLLLHGLPWIGPYRCVAVGGAVDEKSVRPIRDRGLFILGKPEAFFLSCGELGAR
jgi:4-amino-4-deoxy-L-arabinose transferase-like glycosyltransferase